MSKKLFPITIAMAVAAMFVIPAALAGGHGTPNPPPDNPPCDSNAHNGTKPAKKCSTSSTGGGTSTVTETSTTTIHDTTTIHTTSTETQTDVGRFCGQQLGPLPVFFEVEGEPDPADVRDPGTPGDGGNLVHACVELGPTSGTPTGTASPTDLNCPAAPAPIGVNTDGASWLAVCGRL